MISHRKMLPKYDTTFSILDPPESPPKKINLFGKTYIRKREVDSSEMHQQRLS